MIHHDNRPYEVAVSEAGKKMQEKLEGMIHSSVDRITGVISQVQNDVPEDMLVAGKKLSFENSGGILNAVIEETGKKMSIHKHALGQLADRTKIRNFRTVQNELMDLGEWGRNLVAHNLNEVYKNRNGEKYLLRGVRVFPAAQNAHLQLRGFLSDQFRRLDSRPLLDAFISEIQKFGARPVDGFALETKINIRAILPYVFEPVPGEILAFGAELADSDFGDGALSLSSFVLRMWCTNLATTEDVLRKAHLGRRLSDNIEFSQRTLELDTQTMASAVNDVAGQVISRKAVNDYCDMVRKANEEHVDAHQVTAWVKKNLNKGEGEKVVEKFSSADIEMLPPGQTAWRFSNAISWLATEIQDEHRKLELQQLAGNVLKPAIEKEVAAAAA